MYVFDKSVCELILDVMRSHLNYNDFFCFGYVSERETYFCINDETAVIV